MAENEIPTDLTFRSMGSSCRILLDGGPPRLSVIMRQRLDELECAWSRFRDDSEISIVNRAEGAPVLVGPDTLRLIVHARAAWQLTDGWFDPLMLDDLEVLGYDRDHRQLAAVDPAQSPTAAEPSPSATRHSPMLDLGIDEGVGSVILPVGCRLDPGGIGKGLAADIVVEMALDAGARGVAVDLGGDLAVGGLWFGSPAWPALVAHPLQPSRDLAELRIGGGALATSSRFRRRWLGPSGPVHHLLDPHTGRPSSSDVLSASVHAGSAWYAEVLAKACLLAGRHAGRDLIERSGTSAIIYGEDGNVEVVGALGVERLIP